MNRILAFAMIVYLSGEGGLQAQWMKTSGPRGSYIQCLAANGTNLFAGTKGDGVFLSTNNGTSWTAVNSGLADPVVCSLAISPVVGGSGTNLFAGTRSGIFRSTDNGTSWTGTGLRYVNAIAVSPASGGTGGVNLFAGTFDGVFLSTDNGTSWTSKGLKYPGILALAIFPAADGSDTYLFAGTQIDGVFLSTDNGTSWSAVNGGLPMDQYGNFPDVECFAVNGTNLFAGTFGGGVSLSTNNGISWTTANVGLTNFSVRALAHSGTNLFAGTDGGVFLSTDAGASWAAARKGLTHPYVYALAVSPASSGSGRRADSSSGTNLFAGTYGGGVFLSTDNGTRWAAASTGWRDLFVYAFATSPASAVAGRRLATSQATSGVVVDSSSRTNLFVGTYGGGVFRSTDNGTGWTAASEGLMNPNVWSLAVCPASSGPGGSNLFAGTEGGIFRSTDNGESWTATDRTSGLVNAFAVSGSNLFAAVMGYGVFLSTNNGAWWTAVNNGLTHQDGFPLLTNAFAVSPASGGPGTNLFAGTDDGVYRSTDDGTSWTAANRGLPGIPVNALAISATPNGTILFAGVDRGVFRTINNGSSWMNTGTGLQDTFVDALAVTGTTLFAGGSNGVFVSTDIGISWTGVNSGLSNTYVYSLAISPGSTEAGGTDLYAGTGSGVWRLPITAHNNFSIIPVSFLLEQNYPNPFNPSTTIRYGLPKKSQVSLMVYNTLGQLVSELVSGEQEAGYHEVSFAGSGLASGVYFYRMHSGDVVQVKKMVLVK